MARVTRVIKDVVKVKGKCSWKRKNATPDKVEPEPEPEPETAHATKQIEKIRKRRRKRRTIILEANQPEPEPELEQIIIPPEPWHAPITKIY